MNLKSCVLCKAISLSGRRSWGSKIFIVVNHSGSGILRGATFTLFKRGRPLPLLQDTAFHFTSRVRKCSRSRSLWHAMHGLFNVRNHQACSTMQTSSVLLSLCFTSSNSTQQLRRWILYASDMRQVQSTYSFIWKILLIPFYNSIKYAYRKKPWLWPPLAVH